MHMDRKIRLLSYLMRTGEFERSYQAQQAVLKGRVKVDGAVQRVPHHSIKLKARVMLSHNGKDTVLSFARPITLLLDKPRGLVCQKSSREQTVYNLLEQIPGLGKKEKRSLFCVGRLDLESEGLLVLTNQGQLEKALTRDGVVKTYQVKTQKPLSDKELETLESGVHIQDPDTGKKFFVKAVIVKKLGPQELEIGITQGRKRQVKKMIQSVGNDVTSLKRVGIGTLRIETISFKNRFATPSNRELEKLARA